MSATDQLWAVSTWLRARYESAPTAELPLLASVIAYLETLATLEGEREGSATEPEPAEPAQEPRPEPEAPEVRHGTFHETAWGGTVFVDDGSPVRVPYSVVAAAGLCHADRVRLTPRNDSSGHYFFTREGPQAPVPPSTVREVVGLVGRRGNQWQAEVEGHVARIAPATPHLGPLRPGSVVTLRYCPEELEAAHPYAYVVRIHPDNGFEAPAPAERTHRPLHRRTVLRRGSLQSSPLTGEMPTRLPRILVIGGHIRNRPRYNQGLAGLAEVQWRGGTRLTKSLRAVLDSAPAVVLVTQHVSHPVSDHVLAVLRATGKPYILSHSQNRSGLVRQIIADLLPQLHAHDAGIG